jgi:hypothetical protein
MHKNNYLIFASLLIIQMIGWSDESCLCPKLIRGKLCGGFLGPLVHGNDCKYKRIYSCPGTEEESEAIEIKECKMPCLTKQDIETGLVDAHCFPSFPYLLDFEILKRKLSMYKMNHMIDNYLNG